MKKIVSFVLILICLGFVIFNILTSEKIVDLLSNVSAWLLLVIQLILYLFPKIKTQLEVLLAKIINYKTNVHYTIRLDIDMEDLSEFEKDLYLKFNNGRIIKYTDRYDVDIDDFHFKLVFDDDCLYVDFTEFKVGYRDALDEIKKINKIANNILKILKANYEESIFKCEISYDKNNPYLSFLFNSKINQEDVDVKVTSGNLKITNKKIEYWNTDLIEFSNKLEKELLLK